MEGTECVKAQSRQEHVHLGTERKSGALELSESEGPSWRGIWVLSVKVKIGTILSPEQLETPEGLYLGE